MGDQPINRRAFFRTGLRHLLDRAITASNPVGRLAERLAEMPVDGQVKKKQPAPIRRREPLHLPLRPPGALPEKQFLDTCSRCGDCVDVCPAQCILIDQTSGGAPHIEIDTMPCVVCDGLYCMSSCPTGALVPTPLNEIRMGTAVWHEETCLRGESQSCTICVDHCPLGSAAIELNNGRIEVKPLGCIGCGVCQHDCPTSPKSIVIIPVAARQRR